MKSFWSLRLLLRKEVGGKTYYNVLFSKKIEDGFCTGLHHEEKPHQHFQIIIFAVLHPPLNLGGLCSIYGCHLSLGNLRAVVRGYLKFASVPPRFLETPALLLQCSALCALRATQQCQN